MLDAGWRWIDPENQQHPVTPGTLFDLASVSKMFTATTFLSLVSTGMVGLDDALITMMPEFGITDPRPLDGGQDPHTKAKLPTPQHLRGLSADPKRVTYRHLLTHTSGLAAWRAVYLAAGPPPPTNGGRLGVRFAGNRQLLLCAIIHLWGNPARQ